MAWWKHHQNTPVLAEKLEPGGLRRKLRHLAQLLLVNQNGDGGPGPRREWGPGPPQIAAPVGGRGAGCPPYGGGLAVRERPSRRSRTYPPTPEREARQARPPRPQGRFKRVAIRDGRLSDYDDCRVKSRGGIVNLAARGMLVVSVARRIGSGGPLLAYCAARSNRAGPKKGALGPLS